MMPHVMQQSLIANLLQNGSITDFALNLGLDTTAVAFLQALPEEVQSTIVTNFDPSGTKDGNIWGRLFAFVRRVWAQHLGLDKVFMEHLKTLPEDVQIKMIVEG